MADVERPESCALCALVQAPDTGPMPGTELVAAYVDEDLVALLGPELSGVLLAPRQHIGTLSTAPERAAVFLAALRRAVNEVQASYGASGAMIEPTTDLAGAVGHLCYHVVPTLPDDAPPPSLDMVTRTRRLADALRQHAVPHRLHPPTKPGRLPSFFDRLSGLVEP